MRWRTSPLSFCTAVSPFSACGQFLPSLVPLTPFPWLVKLNFFILSCIDALLACFVSIVARLSSQVPEVLKLIGTLYSGWFVYRYLLFEVSVFPEYEVNDNRNCRRITCVSLFAVKPKGAEGHCLVSEG